MRLPLAPLAVALLAALTGCIGASAPPEQPTPTGTPSGVPEAPPVQAPAGTSTEPVASLVVFPYEGKMTAGVGSADLGYVAPLGSQEPHLFGFAIAPGASGLVLEMAWDNPLHDLDLLLSGPTCDRATGNGTCVDDVNGNLGAGDSPVAMVIQDPLFLADAGNWTIGVWAKDAVNTEFRVVATVFYGAPPPAGYTALG